MPTLFNFYQCIWEDADGEQAGCRFYSPDDDTARAQAGRMAARSKCQLTEFGKVELLELPETHPPTPGSNIADRTTFIYKDQGNNPFRVSIPGFDRQYLELDTKKTWVDRIGGVEGLTSRKGVPARGFVKGLWKYSPRKDTLDP